MAIEAARIAFDRHCEDIVVLDLRGISPITDYFVIFTGTSGRQMASVADEIAEAAAKVGHRTLNVTGVKTLRPSRRRRSVAEVLERRQLGEGGWTLLDFVDVVVHIFDDEHRHYYDLELIWGDAPRVRWQKNQPRTARTTRTK